jgi:serine/threonine-protein kinase
MGEVYLARHKHLDRQVALKILPPELAENEGFRERFVRESRSAAALHHPNIVTVYDAGEVDGLLYIAMQFIDGPDLALVLHRDGPLGATRCMLIVEQLADALEAAHARGLIHRDVKPANVLIDGERVYLTDFGLTKPVAVKTAVTAPGVLVGTVDYVAPEQVRGGPVDARADVYALGCLIYRALSGIPPFPRDNEMAVLHAHLYDDPPRLTDLRPDLPAAIDEVIATALAKSPADRFGSAAAVSVATRHALARRADGGEAPTAVVPAQRGTRGPRAPLGRRRASAANERCGGCAPSGSCRPFSPAPPRSSLRSRSRRAAATATRRPRRDRHRRARRARVHPPPRRPGLSCSLRTRPSGSATCRRASPSGSAASMP